jgi:hypothetical protein
MEALISLRKLIQLSPATDTEAVRMESGHHKTQSARLGWCVSPSTSSPKHPDPTWRREAEEEEKPGTFSIYQKETLKTPKT